MVSQLHRREVLSRIRRELLNDLCAVCPRDVCFLLDLSWLFTLPCWYICGGARNYFVRDLSCRAVSVRTWSDCLCRLFGGDLLGISGCSSIDGLRELQCWQVLWFDRLVVVGRLHELQPGQIFCCCRCHLVGNL